MKIQKQRAAVLLIAVLLALPMTAPEAFGADANKAPTGKQVFQTKCMHCHKPSKFSDLHYDRQAWEQIVTRMELNTCILTDGEYKAVSDYLVQKYGD